MRPFQQADPSVQLMLVDRGNRRGTLDRDRAAAPRGARRPVMRTALAALALGKLAPRIHFTRTDIKRDHGRAGLKVR